MGAPRTWGARSLERSAFKTEVGILGGGIIGLSIALELRRRGASVSVFDVGQPARAASWAAAGMLAPSTEHIVDPDLQALCQRSLEAYPQFVRALRAGSSIDPHLRLDGIVSAAHDAETAGILEMRVRRTASPQLELIDRERALALEPALGRGLRCATIAHGEGHVDNRRLGRALIECCTNAGVQLHTSDASIALECDSRRVLGIRTAFGYHAVEWVVNAAGAWASQVSGAPDHATPDVFPVKGQMIALAMPEGLVRHPIWLRGAYVVPRAHGRLLVGATSEDAGFDTRVTAAGVEGLLHAAIGAMPALRDLTVTETWAGLRPASEDRKPFIGPTQLDGYYVAAAHYRNGILLAPETARLMGECLERRTTAELQAFLPGRETRLRTA